MNAYGEWLQLSVFQCRLSGRRRQEFETEIRTVIKNEEDHVMIIDVGLAESAELSIQSIGKSFEVIKREAIVI